MSSPAEKDLENLKKNIRHALAEIDAYRNDLAADDATHNYRHKDSIRFCLQNIERALLKERGET